MLALLKLFTWNKHQTRILDKQENNMECKALVLLLQSYNSVFAFNCTLQENTSPRKKSEQQVQTLSHHSPARMGFWKKVPRNPVKSSALANLTSAANRRNFCWKKLWIQNRIKSISSIQRIFKDYTLQSFTKPLHGCSCLVQAFFIFLIIAFHIFLGLLSHSYLVDSESTMDSKLNFLTARTRIIEWGMENSEWEFNFQWT